MDKETIKRGKITLIATNVTPNRFFYPMIRPIYDYFVLKSQELKTRSDQIMDGLFSTKVPEEIYPKSRLDWTGYLEGLRYNKPYCLTALNITLVHPGTIPLFPSP